MQDVVDVHEVQEDLLLQRSMSMSKQTRDTHDPAKGLAPDLDTIGEEEDTEMSAIFAEHDADSNDVPPMLATQLPAEEEHATKSRPGSREATAPLPIENLEDVSTDDWGLDMLVRVGESWAPNLLLMTAYASPSPHAHIYSKRGVYSLWHQAFLFEFLARILTTGVPLHTVHSIQKKDTTLACNFTIQPYRGQHLKPERLKILLVVQGQCESSFVEAV